MILFVPVIVVCSLAHDMPKEHCASDRPVEMADRNIEQRLINGVAVMRKYGGQDDVRSLGCEVLDDDGTGQPDGAAAR